MEDPSRVEGIVFLGGEVLIKAVAQDIPNYTFSCFKHPISLYNELQDMYARFWQGSTIESQKIHWQSWKRLSVRKDQGGMDFPDITIFNQVMLAKQCWRILRYPNSLLAKVLRGKYFKTGSFLKAKLGSKPSYAWRSILWGRELFEKGYRWRVGIDHSISINSVPWILRDGYPKPVFTPPPLQGCSVAWLMAGGMRRRSKTISPLQRRIKFYIFLWQGMVWMMRLYVERVKKGSFR